MKIVRSKEPWIGPPLKAGGESPANTLLHLSPPERTGKTEHYLGTVTGIGDPLYAKCNDVLKHFLVSVKMLFAGWNRDPASLWKPIVIYLLQIQRFR